MKESNLIYRQLKDHDLTVHIYLTEIEMVNSCRFYCKAEKQQRVKKLELQLSNYKGTDHAKAADNSN